MRRTQNCPSTWSNWVCLWPCNVNGLYEGEETSSRTDFLYKTPGASAWCCGLSHHLWCQPPIPEHRFESWLQCFLRMGLECSTWWPKYWSVCNSHGKGDGILDSWLVVAVWGVNQHLPNIFDVLSSILLYVHRKFLKLKATDIFSCYCFSFINIYKMLWYVFLQQGTALLWELWF